MGAGTNLIKKAAGKGIGLTDAQANKLTHADRNLIAQYNATIDLGLPPGNTAMERAAALGHDPRWFHGSASDIKGFDQSKFGSSTKASGASQAAWMVDDPRTAGGYADYAAAKPIRDLMEKVDTYERLAQKGGPNSHWWDKHEQALIDAENLESSGVSGQAIYPLSVRGNYANHEMGGAEYVDVARDISKALRDAKIDGKSGIQLNELADDVAFNNRPATHLATFDPANIRSRFAAFDPRRLKSNDLLAGGAGLAAIGAGMTGGSGEAEASFLGPLSKTADLAALDTAKALAAKGADRQHIWDNTGWFQGPDQKWRYELSDHNAMYRGTKAAGTSYLDHVMPHEELYKAYPFLRGVRVNEGTAGMQQGGAWDNVRNKIDAFGPNKGSTVPHEWQHAIQDHEGFARGGSPDYFNQQQEAILARDALSWRNELLRQKEKMPKADTMALENAAVHNYQKAGMMDWLPSREARDIARQADMLRPDLYPDSTALNDVRNIVSMYGLDKNTTPYTPTQMYRMLGGEAESRLVQSRLGMTPEERAANPPWLNYDVPESKQKILMDHSPGEVNTPASRPEANTNWMSLADQPRRLGGIGEANAAGNLSRLGSSLLEVGKMAAPIVFDPTNLLGPAGTTASIVMEPTELGDGTLKGRSYEEVRALLAAPPPVSPELAKYVNLPDAPEQAIDIHRDAPRFEYSPEQLAQFQAMFPEAKGYADGGEIVAPEATAAPIGFHGGIFYTGDATAPAAGPFVDNTIGQPFHGGNFYTGDGTPAPQSFTPPAAGSPFHGGIFYTGGDSAPVAPTPAPVVDTGYWTNPIAATQTYYPTAAFDAASPSGYFNYAHNFIQGDKAPSGFTTWAPYVEPPPPQPGYSEGG